jgi:GNAT superfamily N-acetyltransferase
MEWTESALRLTTNMEGADLDAIYQFLRDEAYWCKGLRRDLFDKALDRSINFSLSVSGAQAGYARVITDGASFAYLADVFVFEEFRGRGHSKWMLGKLLTHPDLQNLRRIVLATLDAQILYEQFGFTPLANPEWFMEVLKENTFL